MSSTWRRLNKSTDGPSAHVCVYIALSRSLSLRKAARYGIVHNGGEKRDYEGNNERRHAIFLQHDLIPDSSDEPGNAIRRARILSYLIHR